MGHSSHVTKVKFSSGDKYVISTGGNDKTVIIWETDFGANSNKLDEEDKVQYDDDDDDSMYVGKVD